MRTKTIRFMAVGFTVTLAAIATLRAAEQDAAQPAKPTPPLATTETAPTKRSSVYPFQGVIAKVEKAAMTIALEGKEKPRLILVTSQTRIEKGGKAAIFDDATVGEKVTGQLTKNAEGKEEFVSLYLGPKSSAARPKSAAAPAKAPTKTEPPKPEER